jgi:hypothetical protein
MIIKETFLGDEFEPPYPTLLRDPKTSGVPMKQAALGSITAGVRNDCRKMVSHEHIPII